MAVSEQLEEAAQEAKKLEQQVEDNRKKQERLTAEEAIRRYRKERDEETEGQRTVGDVGEI